MDGRRTGVAALKAVAVIGGIVVAAGVVLYFASDVFSTRVDAQIDQLAHWTPKNIARDPENYLNFCEKQARKAIEDLKANEIGISQSRARLEGMRKDAGLKMGAGRKALDELKELYRSTEASGGWPATWQGQPRERDWTRRQIVTLARQIDSQKALLEKVEAGMKKLDAQVLRVQDAKAKAAEQLVEIAASREMLKVQKITDELTARLVGMKGMLEATISTASETSGMITLDQLAAESTAVVSDAEFDSVMAAPAAGPN